MVFLKDIRTLEVALEAMKHVTLALEQKYCNNEFFQSNAQRGNFMNNSTVYYCWCAQTKVTPASCTTANMPVQPTLGCSRFHPRGIGAETSISSNCACSHNLQDKQACGMLLADSCNCKLFRHTRSRYVHVSPFFVSCRSNI